MNMPLRGRSALVTGASRGVGRAAALKLASLGARVAVTARTGGTPPGQARSVDLTVRELRALGADALGVTADLARPPDVRNVVDTVLAAFGHIDILVNNAAYMADEAYLPFWDVSPEIWNEQFAVNVLAPYALMRGFAPAMAGYGGGLIVNITSGAALPGQPPQPLPGHGGVGAGYAASKAAVNRMTNALANELRPGKITVVAVNPGATLTENYPRVARQFGFDPSRAHDVSVPAKVVSYLATHADPLEYTGEVLNAAEFRLPSQERPR